MASIRSSGYAFLIELNYRAALQGFKIVEVPIVFTERVMGTSKMSGRIVVEAICRVPMLRLPSPTTTGACPTSAGAVWGGP